MQTSSPEHDEAQFLDHKPLEGWFRPPSGAFWVCAIVVLECSVRELRPWEFLLQACSLCSGEVDAQRRLAKLNGEGLNVRAPTGGETSRWNLRLGEEVEWMSPSGSGSRSPFDAPSDSLPEPSTTAAEERNLSSGVAGKSVSSSEVAVETSANGSHVRRAKLIGLGVRRSPMPRSPNGDLLTGSARPGTNPSSNTLSVQRTLLLGLSQSSRLRALRFRLDELNKSPPSCSSSHSLASALCSNQACSALCARVTTPFSRPMCLNLRLKYPFFPNRPFGSLG